jgi:vacuolar-type H+-ATPase subunit F/Vma7
MVARKQKIHLITDDDEILILMNLLGIEGTLLGTSNNFMDKFQELTADSWISIILISMELPDAIVEEIIDYKLNNTKPFIYLMPNLFKEGIDEKSTVLKKVYRQAKKLLN